MPPRWLLQADNTKTKISPPHVAMAGNSATALLVKWRGRRFRGSDRPATGPRVKKLGGFPAYEGTDVERLLL